MPLSAEKRGKNQSGVAGHYKFHIPDFFSKTFKGGKWMWREREPLDAFPQTLHLATHFPKGAAVNMKYQAENRGSRRSSIQLRAEQQLRYITLTRPKHHY